LKKDKENREAIKKAKVQQQAKEKEFGDADTRMKKLRENKQKADRELKSLKEKLSVLEKSGTAEEK